MKDVITQAELLQDSSSLPGLSTQECKAFKVNKIKATLIIYISKYI